MERNLNNKLKALLAEYVDKVNSIYAEKLIKVILYGSYARGDYTPESDIDIMILVDGDHDEVRVENDALASMTYDFDMEHDVYVEYSARSKRYFDYWHKAHPFYQNVNREGIVLYESA